MFKKHMALQYWLEVKPAEVTSKNDISYMWGEFGPAATLEPFLRTAIGWSETAQGDRRWDDDEFRILPVTRRGVPRKRHDPSVIEGAPEWMLGTELEREMIAQREHWAAFAPRLLELADRKRARDMSSELDLDESIQDLDEAARDVPWPQAIDELPVLEYLEGTGLLGRAQFYLVPLRIRRYLDHKLQPKHA
jgi:hypothetical protein